MTRGRIACTLSPGELSARRQTLGKTLASRASAMTRLADGVRVSFPPDAGTVRILADFVEAERRCCPFLRFVLSVEPGDAGIALELTGPPGTGEFLEDLLAPLGRPDNSDGAS